MYEKDFDRKNWPEKGKKIRDLIKELQSFEDQDLLVEMSIDGGETAKPISFIGKKDGKCRLVYLK